MSDAGLDTAQTLRTLREEQLIRWSWFETSKPRADEVGIRRDGEGWLVYSTDERAAEAYSHHHDREGPALVDFLEKVRSTTRYFRFKADRIRAEAANPSVS